MRFVFEIYRFEFSIDLTQFARPILADLVAPCGCSVTQFWIFAYRAMSKECVMDATEQIQFEMEDNDD